MPKPYKKLRARIIEKGYTCPEVGKQCGINDKGAFSQRMNNRTPWKLTEIYEILDVLDIPYSELHKYFPKNGVEPEGVTS